MIRRCKLSPAAANVFSKTIAHARTSCVHASPCAFPLRKVCLHLACCSTAAPLCTTTNEAQHGNVMENCVRRLPSMQRSRISLEAAPRLLPSVFSMNEPGCCRGEQRRRGRGTTRDACRKQTLVHATSNARCKITQNRLRKAQTKRAPLTTDNHLHLTRISDGFAFLGGISQDCNVEESIHLPYTTDAVSSGLGAVEEK